MAALEIHGIDPSRLERMREHASDEHGNPWVSRPAAGWEPLRCCLRIGDGGEAIALISYQPLPGPSPWAEVGPVYVHHDSCAGYASPDRLPRVLVDSPRVLRSYDDRGRLLYDRMERSPDASECEEVLRRLLGDGRVAVVHVRAELSQCFTFAVRRR